MRTAWVVTGGIAAALVAPASALAQQPVPVPPPAKAKLSLKVVSRDPSGGVLAGERWVVRGTLKPYVSGQKATVRVYRHGVKVKVREVAIQPVHGTGRFQLGFTSNTAGRLTVRASHRSTAELATAVATPVHVAVLALHARPGARGLAVRVLQRRLAADGYVVGRRGVFDARTGRAVLAFRKLTGMPRTDIASADVFRRLARGEGSFHVRFPSHGRHVEADISHQVLALIDHGKAVHIYPTSTGAPATPTVRGSFRVYSRTPGYNSHLMYYSSYFIRGYAIHGYDPVPAYNASHGCLRVPVPDAVAIYDWVRLGTPVDVYG